jgi:serine/threonine-protein phosphatase PP1 catalytic subunit
MSVSAELLCSFELLKPLDSSALKHHIKKAKNKRQNMLNSPVRPLLPLYPSLIPQPASQFPQSF